MGFGAAYRVGRLLLSFSLFLSLYSFFSLTHLASVVLYLGSRTCSLGSRIADHLVCHFVSTLSALWDHSEGTFGLLWGHFGITLRSLWDHSVRVAASGIASEDSGIASEDT